MVNPKDKMANGQPCAFCDFTYNNKASPFLIKQHLLDIKQGDYLMQARARQVRLCKSIACTRVEHAERTAEIYKRYKDEEKEVKRKNA